MKKKVHCAPWLWPLINETDSSSTIEVTFKTAEPGLIGKIKTITRRHTGGVTLCDRRRSIDGVLFRRHWTKTRDTGEQKQSPLYLRPSIYWDQKRTTNHTLERRLGFPQHPRLLSPVDIMSSPSKSLPSARGLNAEGVAEPPHIVCVLKYLAW